jgi:hypothetical protein
VSKETQYSVKRDISLSECPAVVSIKLLSLLHLHLLLLLLLHLHLHLLSAMDGTT